jgi:RsiW-degrading membrane proteinase PrsW (M82 family)
MVPAYVFSGILSLVTGALMTRWWGVMGAGFSLLLVYLAQSLVLVKISNDLYPVAFEWKRLGKLAATLGLAFTVAHFGFANTDNPLMAIAAPLVFLLIAALFLLLSSFFERDEIRAFKELLTMKT